jgi:YidC/Oxa1 family membrane protein insertase
VVWLVLTPFTKKSTRSMWAMNRLQPVITRLQAQHKNDRQALNEAMMAFYKEHNVNPLSGCLPMLLQMPVFFGLYEAIRGLTHNAPKDLSHSTKLFTSLCPGFNGQYCQGSKSFVVEMKVLGMDLAKSVSSNHGSLAKALPFYLLIALTTATQYYQQRQITNRNPQAAQANPQMQMMQKFFPIIFLVIYINIPAAVVVYFLTSNVLRIGLQGAMWRWDPKLAAEVATEVSEVERKSKAIDAKSRPVAKADKGDRASATGTKGRPAKPETPEKELPAKASGGATNGRSAGKPNVAKPGGPKATGGKPPAGKPNAVKPSQSRERRGR